MMSTRRLLVFVGMAAVMAGLAGFFVWERYWGNAEYREYLELERRYIEAMTNDTYGGKTPQETLDMFVEALKAEDVELASKYFMLDDNLSREKWLKTLRTFKERGLLDDMAMDIEKEAKPLIGSYEGDFAFGLFNDDNTVATKIDMQFNTYSNVWKIESL